VYVSRSNYPFLGVVYSVCVRKVTQKASDSITAVVLSDAMPESVVVYFALLGLSYKE